MKIETDQAHIVSGVRHSKTIGSPIAILLENKDWKNWTEALPVEDSEGGEDRKKPVTRPRPGHADLAGAIKYNFMDARYILERASARETTARVAVGAFAKAYLAEFGIGVLSHVIAVGEARLERAASWEERVEPARRSSAELRGCRGRAARRPWWTSLIKPATRWAACSRWWRTGPWIKRTLPGTPARRQAAQAIVSMQAVKGVEIGFAAEVSGVRFQVQDTIHYGPRDGGSRAANRAGGLEGGMTNGRDILVRGMLKPISTLRRPLESVDLETREPALAAYERSDVAVVPAAGVIGEAMVSLVLAAAMIEKFGGDSLGETKRNFEGYLEQVKNF
jgi:chorismate synthase